MKRTGRQRSRSRVMWDEENLSYLELNKTPKREITEPKTPYYAPGTENGDGDIATLDNVAHAKAIWNALTEVASTSGGHKTSGGCGWTSSEDEADEMDCDREGTCYVPYADSLQCLMEEKLLPEGRVVGNVWRSMYGSGLGQSGHRLSFIEHRKAHYDEYRKIRALQQQGSVINEGDDDGYCKQRGKDQEMLADGIDSMGIQDTQSSGRSHKNYGRQSCNQ